MPEPKPGPRNLITDVDGILVGNAEDHAALTGVSVVTCEAGMAAGVDVRGGAPGTRNIELLDPSCLVEEIHAITLSGGSVFGEDAAGGVIAALAQRGVGFTFGNQPLPCPVVPGAILFDLKNGGNKSWGLKPPYWQLGISALEAAAPDFELGNAGAGLGCLAGDLKGGLGSASCVVEGVTVGALVAVNSFGSVVDPRTGDFWARAFELGEECGGRAVGGPARGAPSLLTGTKATRGPGVNTTIAVVATDAHLDKAQCRRVAIMAGDGMARAVRPVHAPFDGDAVFAVSTRCGKVNGDDPAVLNLIGSAAADCLARAIARGVYEAKTISGHASWRQRLGR
jgi:L-aminopeptidase/D-esterase-like protein